MEVPEIDDLSVSLVKEVLVEPEKKQPAEKKVVIVARPAPDVLDETEEAAKARQRSKQRGKELVFDENAGRVVVKRKRKGSRRRGKWDEIEESDDIDTLTDDGF